MAIPGRDESLFRVHSDLDINKGHNIMIYKGPFGKNAIALFQTYCNDLLVESDFLKKKILSLFVELVQNINLYSAERDNTDKGKSEGLGFMSISRKGDAFTITSGNPSEKDDLEKLVKLVDKINTIDDRSKLHAFKRELWNKEKRTSEAANFGLVQCALIAGSKIAYESTKTDNGKYFITLEFTVKAPEKKV